ncbi:sigma factor-like helix-turn-helix DNA-binding protein [Staphylococcus simulans]|uniref:sigma factor-like helix-turn-helix DNA-binding protein n=5 Tax=Staphylococcus simulans TaxID=1286 RepID=UPI0021D0027C|nr:sigma factor-like helix-turn-helix DNA-binding protein [Staphylococcus simulans]UXR52742.1 hypothetical protein MUA82_01040 [Staphylococcus simulans]WMM10964.1 sigma factor-like helix-turn-helix DNA-binding protein [Staphylococcus simulans]
MLEDIVNIPQIIQLAEVRKNSKNFREFFNDHLIDNLREMYIKDIKKFNSFKKEMFIRGIGFKEEYQNNFLKGANKDIFPFLYKEYNENRFKEIIFDKFGIGDLIDEFNVKSDLFFNYISLPSLLSIIPKEKRVVFQNKIKDCGYRFIYEEVKEHRNINSRDLFKQFPEKYEHFIQYCERRESNDSIEELLENYKKEALVSDEYFKSLVDHCKQMNLLTGEKLQNTIQYLLENIRSFNNNCSSLNINSEEFFDVYFNENNLHKSIPFEVGEKFFLEKGIDSTSFWSKINEYKNIFTTDEKYNQFKKISINEFLYYKDIPFIFQEDQRKIEELGTNVQDLSLVNLINDELEIKNKEAQMYLELIMSLNAKQKFALTEKSKEYTLQKIGEEMGVTRERVRQIIKKAINIITTSRYSYHITKIINNKLKNKNIVKMSEVLSGVTISEEKILLVEHVILENENFKYIDNIRLIVEQKFYEKLYKELKGLIDKGEVIIKYNKSDEDKQDLLSVVSSILREFNFLKVNNQFVKNNISISEALSELFKKNKHMVVSNTEEGFVKLKKLLKENFGINIVSSKRALFTRLEDAKNVIQIDRARYKYEDYKNVNPDLLEDISQKLNKTLKHEPYANTRSLYQDNLEIMSENNIISHFHLYYLIKQKLSTKFDVGFQNTMYVFKKNEDSFRAEEILLRSLRVTKPKKKDDLLKELGWKDYKLDQTIAKSNSVITNERNKVILIEGIENERHYEDLIEKIKDDLEKGYIYTVDTLTSIMFDEKLSKILTEYQIIDLVGFSQFVKTRLSNIRGHKSFLFKNETKIKNVEDVILNDMPILFTGKQLKNFMESKGYSEQKFYMCVGDLISRKYVYNYNKNVYLNVQKNRIDYNIVRKMINRLNTLFEQNSYLTYMELQDVSFSTNEDTSLKMTPTLIASLAEEFGYQTIEPYPNSKVEIPVIVKNNSYTSYADLVHSLIREEYNDEFDSKSLIKFLKKVGLMNTNAHKLYYSLENSDLFRFNDYGNFKLLDKGEE